MIVDNGKFVIIFQPDVPSERNGIKDEKTDT